MKAKPKTTYNLVSPDTWALIRAAYLSGLSGPTVAARFSISVGALRKRAAREQWRKRDFLAANPCLAMGQPHAVVVADVAPARRGLDGEIDQGLESVTAAVLPATMPHADALSRRALLMASHALAQDRPRDALAHAKAAEAIARLDQLIPDVEPAEDDQNVHWRHREMKRAIWQTVCRIVDHLHNGGEAPMGFAEEIAAMKAERAAR